MLKVKVRGVAHIDDKILLCKWGVTDNSFFCLPGGTMEGGEDRVTTLKREFIEELNVEPVIGDILYINEFVRGNATTLDFWYTIKNPKDFLNIDLDSATHGYELAEVGFYRLDNFIEDLRPHFLPKLFEDFLNGSLTFDTSYA